MAANPAFLASVLSACAVLLAALSLGVAISAGHFHPRGPGVWIAGNLVLGSAALSIVIFFSGLVLISRHLYVAILAMCLAAGWMRLPRNAWQPFRTKIPWVLAAAGVIYFALYVFTASFPETSPDGASYHLGYLARYIAAGHIYKVETSFYPMLSQGFEMLYLPALLFGGGTACALLHTLFVSVMLLLFTGFSELLPISDLQLAAAAIMFYATPVVGRTTTTAYIDSAAACVCLAAVYFTLLACRDRQTPQFIFAGVCCSFALSVKLSTVPIVPLCIVLLLVKARPIWKQVSVFLLACGAVETVWLARNWIWYRNPIVPFGNSFFPNAYVHASFETEYRQYLSHFEGLSLSPSLFLETTVHGFISQGLIGPLYLLFPIAAIIQLARKQFLWPVATMFMLLAYPQNLGTRFLEPALPFAALTIVSCVAAIAPRFVVLFALFTAAISWPSVVDAYASAHPYARALPAPTIDAIFHRPSQTEWLEQRLNSYPMVRYIADHLPADAQILAQPGLPLLYVRPAIRVWYESAENERLRDVLQLGLAPGNHPFVRVTLTPSNAVSAARFRLRPARISPDAQWSIAEITAPTGAKLDCVPDSYDCGRLIDGNPVTLWHNWEPLPAAAHVDLNFDAPIPLTPLKVLCPAATATIGFRLEACQKDNDNDCREVPATATIHDQDIEHAAEFAAREFRRVGIGYLLIDDDGLNAAMKPLVSAGLFQELFTDKSSRLYQVVTQ